MWCPVEHWLGVDVFRSYFTSDMECPQYRMQMTATTRGNCGAGIDCLNKSVTLLWRGLVFDTWVSEENSVSRCQGQMAKHRTSAQSHGADVSVEMTVKVHLQHDDVHTFIHLKKELQETWTVCFDWTVRTKGQKSTQVKKKLKKKILPNLPGTDTVHFIMTILSDLVWLLFPGPTTITVTWWMNAVCMFYSS